MLAALAVSEAVKFALGTYTIQKGRETNSSALGALGTDGKNDFIVSSVTIVSAVVFITFDVSIDAYAGIITSLFILKAAYGVLSETVGALLGTPADKKLADMLYREIRSTPFVLNAADMTNHNYGPDSYSGSVNIEIDHDKTIGEVYETIHKLQLSIMHKYGVTMVFGMYAVDKDHEKARKMRRTIDEFVKNYPHALSFHALYLPPDKNKIYCDIVVDYELKDWEILRSDFAEFMKKSYLDDELELVIETEFV